MQQDQWLAGAMHLVRKGQPIHRCRGSATSKDDPGPNFPKQQG